MPQFDVIDMENGNYVCALSPGALDRFFLFVEEKVIDLTDSHISLYCPARSSENAPWGVGELLKDTSGMDWTDAVQQVKRCVRIANDLLEQKHLELRDMPKFMQVFLPGYFIQAIINFRIEGGAAK